MSFPHGHDALTAAGGRLSPLALTEHPWDPAALKNLLARSRHTATYFIPDFHNPTGAVMSDADRVVELSRMLGGDADSAAARKHAKELLSAARKQRAG